MTFVLDTRKTGTLPSTAQPFTNRLMTGTSDKSVLVRTDIDAAVDPVSRATPASIVASHEYSDLEVRIAEEDRAFWCFMKPCERPSFTLPLLRDLAHMQSVIDELFAATPRGAAAPFDYFVLGSRSQGVFNLGGDLNLFAAKIRAGDREGLRRYAHACVHSGYANYTGYGHGVVTIALIQGDALGGGLEAPLSCDIMVAERQAKFGLPEVLFNLFPGMGAYSFLSRRIGAAKAEEMILSGRLYTAAEMHALGVVDVLAEPGEGERAVREYIARNRPRLRAQSAVYKIRRRVNPVPLQELLDVTDLWVDTALGLSEQDLRRMSRIAAAQQRAIGTGFAARSAAH
jgi:DSF synthase